MEMSFSVDEVDDGYVKLILHEEVAAKQQELEDRLDKILDALPAQPEHSPER